MLGQGEASDRALARLQDLILDEFEQPLLLIGMKGERAGLAEIIRRIREGEIAPSELTDERRSRRDLKSEAVTPWGKVWFDEQQAIGMDGMNGAVSIARRPALERRAPGNLGKPRSTACRGTRWAVT